MKTIALFLMTFLPWIALQANDTAMHSGESGPEPVGWLTGEESIVQMVSEHIQVRFGKKKAEVIVRFTFRSHKKDGVAKQTLGFPDEFHIKDLEWDVVGPLKKMRTYVDGKKVRTKIKHGAVFIDEDQGKRRVAWSKDEAGEPMAWHVVVVEFPPGKDVIVERRYETKLGATAGGPIFFSYTTFTGGNWRGRIEQMIADIILEDGLTTDDVAVLGYNDPPKGPQGNGKHAGAIKVSETQLRLAWKNFEPRDEAHRQGFRIDWWDPEMLRRIEEGE